MENTIPCAEIVPAMKAEATQVVVASTEDGIGNNETTNGVKASSGEVNTEETVKRAMQHLATGKRHIFGKLAWEMLELVKTILNKQAESIRVCLRYHRAVSAADDKEAEERAKLKDDIERKVSNAFQTIGESSMETEETVNMAIINMAAGKRPYISPAKLAMENLELGVIVNAIKTLVELSMENESFQQTIEDLQTCLARRQQMMPEDSRCIAATHRIGVAQGFNMEFDEAILELNDAIKILELRIERLKSKAGSVDPTNVGDACSTREKEIKEIESLIPKIREKIADTKDMKIETHKILKEKRLMEEGIATDFKSGDDGSLNGDGLSKAASTISSSLIGKRPAVDSSPSDAKKAHIDVEDKE